MTSSAPTLTGEASSTTDPDQTHLLHIYLRNHEAAAASGLQLVRRCAQANEGTALAPELRRLLIEIRTDRAALQDICRALGVRLSVVERTVAVVGATVGRLKVNGRLFHYSPLSRVVELEALSSGVMAKLRLWQSLSHLSDSDTRLDGDALRRHITEAKAQLKTIARLHEIAVGLAFT